MAAISKVAQGPVRPIESEEDEFGEIVRGGSGGARPDYSVNEPLGTISGYTAYTPTEMAAVASCKQRIARTYELYGYTPIENRPVEYLDNLLKKGGLTKQIYGVSRAQDGGLTKLGLPFDRTLPLAIFIAQNFERLTFPYMRYDIGYAFRGEHAKKGRYRAFYQADNDIIDRKLTPRSDAQTLVATIKGLQAVGVKNCQVFVNHIAIAKAFILSAGVPEGKFSDALRAIDKLKPDNRTEVIKELIANVPELNEAAAGALLDSMSYRGPISEFRFTQAISAGAVEALQHLVEVERACTLMGIPEGMLQFCPCLTRGLDYYTGIVFETFMKGKERYGSIASGGRYSNLVDGFSDKATGLEGVGGSIGLTRLFDILKEESTVDLTKQTTAQVFVGYRILEEGCFEKAMEVAGKLRDQGISVELYSADKIQVKRQLDLCNRKGIPLSVIVMRSDEVVVKNMKFSQQEQFSDVDLLIGRVKALAEKAPSITESDEKGN